MFFFLIIEFTHPIYDLTGINKIAYYLYHTEIIYLSSTPWMFFLRASSRAISRSSSGEGGRGASSGYTTYDRCKTKKK